MIAPTVALDASHCGTGVEPHRHGGLKAHWVSPISAMTGPRRRKRSGCRLASYRQFALRNKVPNTTKRRPPTRTTQDNWHGDKHSHHSIMSAWLPVVSEVRRHRHCTAYPLLAGREYSGPHTPACRSKVIGHCPRGGLVIEPQFVEVINQLPQQLRNILHAREVLLESLARMQPGNGVKFTL